MGFPPLGGSHDNPLMMGCAPLGGDFSDHLSMTPRWWNFAHLEANSWSSTDSMCPHSKDHVCALPDGMCYRVEVLMWNLGDHPSMMPRWWDFSHSEADSWSSVDGMCSHSKDHVCALLNGMVISHQFCIFHIKFPYLFSIKLCFLMVSCLLYAEN